jgi:phosphopantothenoylcysteine decarboxylase / phosphopantothenate---cysteine ligase
MVGEGYGKLGRQMTDLTGKRILVGITGGIAAYKAAELVRRLRDVGATVHVVMTQAACAFITPLTLQALSGHAVHRHLLEPESEAAMSHIYLARWADLVVIAPATAHTLARLAHGFADDLLAAIVLVTEAPIYVAPAMNQRMWLADATQENLKILQRRGVVVLGPASGDQACGEIGPGRMLEAADIVSALRQDPPPSALRGLRVLVTAGPTREALDPVRYISNRSSGKMGYAVAAAAAAAGAKVTLVSGPVTLDTPLGVSRTPVETAAEMAEVVLQNVAQCEIFIAVAAVADYRPCTTAEQKLKKSSERFSLELEPTQDILAAVAALPNRPFTVGFAAETENLIAAAKDKMRRKNLDMIAANRVGEPGFGFESNENALEVLWADGRLELARSSKETLARQLITAIAERYHAQHPA